MKLFIDEIIFIIGLLLKFIYYWRNYFYYWIIIEIEIYLLGAIFIRIVISVNNIIYFFFIYKIPIHAYQTGTFFHTQIALT